MYKKKTMLFLYAESPIHAGAGAGVGYIDLPLQRECFTGLPIIQASGVKGSLREYFESLEPNPTAEILTAFGPKAGEGAAEYAGALGIGEARLLLFPVRSLYGIFAYLTCPFVLHRFKRDLELIDASGWPAGVDIPEPEEQSTILVISPKDDEKTVIVQQTDEGPKAVFNEFCFNAQEDENVRKIAEFVSDHALPGSGEYASWRAGLPLRFTLVPDNVFKDFTSLAIEVVARNRINDETGTVETGGLWTEEYLPSESLLYSIILAANPFKQNSPLNDAAAVADFVKRIGGKRFQIGGNQTIGKGIVIAHFLS